MDLLSEVRCLLEVFSQGMRFNLTGQIQMYHIHIITKVLSQRHEQTWRKNSFPDGIQASGK